MLKALNVSKVDVTIDSNDVYTFYVDTESYLLIKSHAKVFMSGQAVEIDTYYSNYKDVEGIDITRPNRKPL
ncbi:MAG: hypothetical protein IPQ11_16295 [Bacteroidetes bacterium]|nr:hypothetical protein [Bacteroidota bacterium]